MIQNYILTPSKKFTLKDLHDNKEGKLTPDQKLQLEKSMGRIVGTFLLVSYIGACCSVYRLDSSLRYEINNFTITGIMWLIFIVSIPLGIHFITKRIYKIYVEKMYKIYTIQGIVQKINDSDSLSLKIDKIEFSVVDIIYNMIEEGKPYAFYYIQLPLRKGILSWEEL